MIPSIIMFENVMFSTNVSSLPSSGIRSLPRPGSNRLMPTDVSVITRLENVQFLIVPSFIHPILIPLDQLVRLQFRP